MAKKPVHLRSWALLLLAFLCFLSPLQAQEQGGHTSGKEKQAEEGDTTFKGPMWSPFIRGLYARQFDTDIKGGGSFHLDRLFVAAGVAYLPAPGRNISLSLGYGRQDYGFSGAGKLSQETPWGTILQYRVSVPVRWRLDETWGFFVMPTLRFAAEEGADLGDAMLGGGFIGFTHRISDRLTLGPGIGFITEIKDRPSIIPAALIEWKITDSFTLQTGSGLGSTQGPGLAFNWAARPQWTFSLGFRYEKLRFRLDQKQGEKASIGQDRSFPVYLGVAWNPSQMLRLNLMGGVELGGELRLEDEHGNLISKAGHDLAPFLGFDFLLRF